MNANQERTLDDLECFRDVPEHHDAVDPSFKPDFRQGYLLDGRFRIGEPISRSGMAFIYKAEDTHNQNELVAVKVPHLRYEADPSFYARFQREEEIGLKLNHPFLLKFIRVEGKSRPYIVTEYLRGCTLGHLLWAMPRLPEKDALRIGSLICEGLQYLHEQGVVHRDLKPANIMICRDRTIRIMDFGIATAADSRRITISGFHPTMGTPDYMTPEQVRNERGDARSDIYSLGAIFYEMLTGVVAFQHENPWVSMNNRTTGDPIAPRKINPGISAQAEEIILHAMQRDPDDRYPTVAAMKAELDAPQKVKVTGYCNRLEKPRWKLSLRGTPVIAGSLIGIGFITLQVLAFLYIRHLGKH